MQNNLRNAIPAKVANSKLIIKKIQNHSPYKHIIAETLNDKKKIKLIYSGIKKLQINDEIFIFKELKKIDKSTNLFIEQDRIKGISYTGFISDDDIEIIKKGKTFLLSSFTNSMRNTIKKLYKKTDTAALMLSLIIGDKDKLSQGTLLDFKKSGLMHMLAISGLHIGILIFLPCLLFNLFLKKKYSLMLVSILIFLYLIITGMPMSLMRCTAMYGIYTVQIIMHRERNSFNVLCLAAIIILNIAPHEIFNLSFQLSFAATAGIIVFYKTIEKHIGIKNRYLSKSLSITLSSQIFVLPILWYHLNEINTAGIASNIIIIPLLIIVLITGIFSLALYPLYIPLAHLVAKITDFFTLIMTEIVKIISNLNLSFYSKEFYCLILIIVILLVILKNSEKKYINVIMIITILILPFLFSRNAISNRPKLESTMSGLVRINKNTILLTSKKSYDSKRILQYFKSYLIKIDSVNIKYCTISNFKLTMGILKNYRLKKIILNNFSPEKGLLRLLEKMEKDKVKIFIK